MGICVRFFEGGDGISVIKNLGVLCIICLVFYKVFIFVRVSCGFYFVKGIFLFFVSGEWLCLKVVVGYSGNGWVNMVWRLDIGFFVYMCGCLVVVEDLYFGV